MEDAIFEYAFTLNGEGNSGHLSEPRVSVAVKKRKCSLNTVL